MEDNLLPKIKNRPFPISFIGLFLLSFSTLLHAEMINLRMPIMSDAPQQFGFYHALVKRVLEDDGHEVHIENIMLPQLRIVNMLKAGRLSLFWMLKSAQRDKAFINVNIGLTDGLIGRRILLIRPEEQPLFDSINTLDQLRDSNLIAALGEHWFDVDVWRLNRLKYRVKGGNWQLIYNMLANHRIYDYFPRGVNEVAADARLYPALKIEDHLVLQYDRDFNFYLGKSNPESVHLAALLSHALLKAKRNGTITELVNNFWKDDFKMLHYWRRQVIHLKTPK